MEDKKIENIKNSNIESNQKELPEINSTYSYKITKDGVVITKYLKEQKEVIVPDTIGNIKVTEIGNRAFERKNKTEKIILPKYLKKIGNCTFNNCEKLSTIEIPDTVTEIGKSSFYALKNLKEIKLPASLKVISRNLFKYAENIREIKIPEGVTEIQEGAFFGCHLARLYIPSSVTNISKHLFTSPGDDVYRSTNEYKYKDLDITSPIKFFVKKDSYADKFIQEYRITAGDPEINLSKTKFFNIIYDNETETTLEEANISNFNYSILESKQIEEKYVGTYWIRGLSGMNTESRLVIPNVIEGIPVTTVSIGYYFGDKIEEIYIPSNIAIIDKLPKVTKKIEISEQNPNLSTDGIAIYNKNKTKLIKVCLKDIEEYQIPNTVIEISKNAFDECEKLKEVTIPSSVKVIKEKAFYECKKLKIVNGGENVETVDETSFNSTPWYHKTDMVILGNTLLKCNLKDKVITLPEGIKSLGNNALAQARYGLYNEVKTEKIILPNSLESIGEATFAYNRNLKEITLPNCLTKIPTKLFEDCESLKEIIIPEGVTIIEKEAFQGCRKLKKVKLPNSLTTISERAFEDCRSLEEIIIPDSVTTIEKEVFKRCEKLRKITLPKDLKEISTKLFFSCSNLEEIAIPNIVEKIKEQAFNGCTNLKEINLPLSLKEIEKEAFYMCNKIEKIFIPKNVEKLTSSSFQINHDILSLMKNRNAKEGNFRYIEIDEESPYYTSIDGVLFTKDLKKLIYVPNYWDGEVYTVPEQTEIIETEAFKNNDTIKKIIFPDTVKEIGASACESCKKLEEVILPKNMKKLSPSIFENCQKLSKIKWPENLEEIKDCCFTATNIKKLDFPDTVTTLGDHAFAFIKAKKITIPKTVKKIGLSVLAGIKEIEVYDNIDDEAKPAIECFDDTNGYPNSNVGWLGICWCRGYVICASEPNSTWYNHTITVKSAETGKIKYRVPMYGKDELRKVYCMLSSSWGKNAEFDFNRLDEYFKDIKDFNAKIKISIYRLEDNYNLNDETKEVYKSYLKKNGIKVINNLIEENDIELLENVLKYDVVTKTNIDKAIAYAKEKNKTNIEKYLENYKKEVK